MKSFFVSPKLLGILSLVIGQCGLAQPWSVPASPGAAPQVRPPGWTNIATAAPPVAPPPQFVAPPQPHLASQPLAPGILAFDAEQKDYLAKAGEANGSFVFNITNVSPGEVTINAVQTSCGCTTAKIQLPMKLAPGAMAEIPINMSLLGKSGDILKTVTILTDHGQKVVAVKSSIQAPTGDPAAMAMNRERNQLLATQDRQAVFKGDCARCHVEPVIGKMGKELYVAACGICHEAEHRASMVTDLHNLKTPPNAEYWKFFVVNGKPGTLMPAFSQAQGGPLSDAQVASLVEYLVKDFPNTKTNTPGHASPH
jgi:mono/diheme cytochrome c family protein